MNESATIVIKAVSAVKSAIERLLALHPDLAENILIEDLAEHPAKAVLVACGQSFYAPFRAGAFLEALTSPDLPRNNISELLKIHLGPYIFDPAYNVLERAETSEIVRLTDKESEILRVLHAQGGKPLPREDLLRQVWGYVQGVETHTLETHIYRLRQKIEADPSTPEILLTHEDGYVLEKCFT